MKQEVEKRPDVDLQSAFEEMEESMDDYFHHLPDTAAHLRVGLGWGFMQWQKVTWTLGPGAQRVKVSLAF